MYFRVHAWLCLRLKFSAFQWLMQLSLPDKAVFLTIFDENCLEKIFKKVKIRKNKN
tara:strand:- start:16426 stop:16593 length:168 start_codon:yes stop_codon:yes gene_type:complete